MKNTFQPPFWKKKPKKPTKKTFGLRNGLILWPA